MIPLRDEQMYWSDGRLPEWMILDRLTPIILSFAEGCVVDIGMGDTTEILLRHTQSLGRRHYSIDTDGRKCARYQESEFHHVNHVIWHGRSLSFFDIFDQSGDLPALVMMDGQHDYRTMHAEAHFYLERMEAGGALFMHDTCPMEGYYEKKLESKGREMEGYKIRQEIEKISGYDILTWRYGVGLSMVLKKDMSQPFYRL